LSVTGNAGSDWGCLKSDECQRSEECGASSWGTIQGNATLVVTLNGRTATMWGFVEGYNERKDNDQPVIDFVKI
jgi:hypothetical protein